MATEDELYKAWKIAREEERHRLEGEIFEEVAQHTTRVMGKMKLNSADVARDAALAVIERLPGFKGESKFSTWSEQISRNKICDYLKDLQLQRKKLEDIDNHEHADARSADEKELILGVDRERLERELSIDQRKVLDMHLEGFKQYEIAAFLELPTDNVESKLRAIREIAKKSKADSGK
jgi:RNA polymerase sigma factor (sigma-70 family)